MDSVTPADRRAAQRRVGAAASLLFVLLVLLGVAAHGPAEASPAAPAATPTAVPGEVAPEPGFPHHDRDGDGAPPGFRGGGPGDGASPAPDSGTGTNTT